MDKKIPEKEIRLRKRKTITKIAVVVTVVVAIVTLLFSMLEKSVDRNDIKISEADRGTIEVTASAIGKVVPAFEEIINSPITTKILEVYKQEGDTVSTGTPLLMLDLQSSETELNNMADELRMKQYELEQTGFNNHTCLSNIEMQIKVKEMEINRRRAEVDNERRLDSLGSGTGDKVRQAELAYNTGRLELEQLRQQLHNEKLTRDAALKMKQIELSIASKNMVERQRTLNDARILSPRNATLTYINRNVGQHISQGEKVAVVSDLSHFKIEAEIADSYSSRILPGAKTIIKSGQKTYGGQVVSVTPMSNNGTIKFTILPENKKSSIRSGQKTDVFVVYDISDEVVRIANGPYYNGPGKYDIFIMTDNNRLTRREVTLGESNYDYVEVVEGVLPGEKAVVSDMTKFKTNKTLKIKY